jgi:hypothetical protein
MIPMAGFLLDHASSALIVFMAGAAFAGLFTPKPTQRIATGLVAVALAAVLISISDRTLFQWLAATIARASAPGFGLMIVFAIAAATGRNYRAVPEFRFATAMLALGGLVLYPSALGFFDYDTYVLGYSGYLLPFALAAVLGYAVYRRYLLVAACINIGILAFLFSAGRSLNLWDYIIDPVAWVLAIGSWAVIAIDMRRAANAKVPRVALSLTS